jgi:hypothetical protein
MEKFLRALEHHMVQYLIVGLFGVFAAFLFFKLGGSFAKVTGQENTVVGISFEAGGGFGGFLLVFLLSVWVIGRLRDLENQERRLRGELADREQQLRRELADREQQLRTELAERERTFRENLERRYDPANDPITLKLYFKSKPKFEHSLVYTCVCSLYNEDTGTKIPVQVETYWEAGFLAVTVKGVGRDDYLDVRLEAGGKVWSCDRFHAAAHVVELSPA